MWVSKYVTYLLHHSSNIARRMVQMLFENYIFALVQYSTTGTWYQFYNIEVVERFLFGNLFRIQIKDIHVVYLLYKFNKLYTPSRRQKICIWIICCMILYTVLRYFLLKVKPTLKTIILYIRIPFSYKKSLFW